jgi:hypothetical protein
MRYRYSIVIICVAYYPCYLSGCEQLSCII